MLSRLRRIIGVVTRGVPGREDVQNMVQIVIPLRGKAGHAAARPLQVTGLVPVVLEDEVDFAIDYATPHGLADFADDVGLALVKYRGDGIEPEPVKLKFLEPIKSVRYEKIAHRPAV